MWEGSGICEMVGNGDVAVIGLLLKALRLDDLLDVVEGAGEDRL